MSLSQVLGMDVKKTGLLAGLPYLLSMAAKFISGPINDRLPWKSERIRINIFSAISQVIIYGKMPCMRWDAIPQIKLYHTDWDDCCLCCADHSSPRWRHSRMAHPNGLHFSEHFLWLGLPWGHQMFPAHFPTFFVDNNGMGKHHQQCHCPLSATDCGHRGTE
jgi:hypothetical protein